MTQWISLITGHVVSLNGNSLKGRVFISTSNCKMSRFMIITIMTYVLRMSIPFWIQLFTMQCLLASNIRLQLRLYNTS